MANQAKGKFEEISIEPQYNKIHYIEIFRISISKGYSSILHITFRLYDLWLDGRKYLDYHQILYVHYFEK